MIPPGRNRLCHLRISASKPFRPMKLNEVVRTNHVVLNWPVSRAYEYRWLVPTILNPCRRAYHRFSKTGVAHWSMTVTLGDRPFEPIGVNDMGKHGVIGRTRKSIFDRNGHLHGRVAGIPGSGILRLSEAW